MNKRGVCIGLAAALMMAGLTGCKSTPAMDPAPSESDMRQAMQLAGEAQAAVKAGDAAKAIELNNRALALRPDLSGVWNNLGLALMARGTELDYMQAAEAFKRAAGMLPTDERPYQNLGVLYHERGFSEEALRYFGLALERNPNSLESLRGAVGSAKKLLRSEEVGLERVNRALMIDSDPAWRKIEEFERMRIQQDLVERRRTPTM